MADDELDDGGTRRLSAIVFSDIVGYSKMMGEDERATIRLVEEHNSLLVPIVQRHHGRILKFIGDAILSSFAGASEAVLCGVAIQRAVAARNKDRPKKEHFQVRIGIHIGDITEKAGEVSGDGVNIAARIQPLADPGGICISQTVYDIVRARREIRMVSLGPRGLKNIKEAVHIYKVDVGGGASAAAAKAKWPLYAGTAVFLLGLGALWGSRRPASTAKADASPPQPTAQRPPELPPAARPPQGVAPAAASSDASPRLAPDSPLLKAAWRRYLDGQADAAIDDVAKELSMSPGSAKARQLRALLYDEQKQHLDAAAEYAAAAEAFGKDEEALFCRLLRFLDLKREGRDAQADLSAALAKGGPTGWPLPLARFMSGAIDEPRLAAAERKAGAAAKARPSAYYLGMNNLLLLESAPTGDPRAREYLARAKELLKAAAESKATLEGRRAALELARLRARGDL